jgi:hypothetical protein
MTSATSPNHNHTDAVGQPFVHNLRFMVETAVESLRGGFEDYG